MKKILGLAPKWFGLGTIAILAVAGCARNLSVPLAPDNSSGPTATPTNTVPTATPTPTKTSTSTATPLITSTNTNSPTITNTPTTTPTATITQTSTLTATPTITNTPGPATPTSTPTPIPANPNMISDFEGASPNCNPGPNGTWNGAWAAVDDGSVSIALNVAAPGAYGTSGYCMQVTCGPATQYANVNLTFTTPPSGSNSTNLSAYTGIVFDAIANGGSATLVSVALSDSDTNSAGGLCSTNCYNFHEKAAALPTSWAPVTVFFSQLVQPNSGLSPYPVAFKPSAVYSMVINLQTGKTYNFSIDNVRLITAAPPAGSSGANVISDFENGAYTINPNLTGLPSGATGFSYYVGNGGTQIPLVQNPGYGSNYALHMSGSWTDPANSSYPSAGPVAHFNAPGNFTNLLNVSSFTGVRFDMNLAALSTTGATPPTLGFSAVEPLMVPAPGGTCPGGCYAYFNAVLPNTAGGGWQPVTVVFANLVRPGTTAASGYWAGGLGSCSYTSFTDGCNDTMVMDFGWAAAGNNIAGTYNFDYWLDNITLY